ncbi:hypothetical protein Lesp02_71670 [Lentzea sp. NBRC 105346]|nr:hypothetical protein Lesp02_71670 [Lentzea sp. NBRC 105346]
MARVETQTGGRAATTGVIAGRWALSVGNPGTPTASGFTWVQLSEIARLESGHTPSRRRPEYWDGDIPWVGIRDATANHGRTITSTTQSITKEGLANSSARLLPTNTVCLSRTASVGYVVTIGTPMATSQDFVNWICGPQISHKYLHYILMSEQDSVRRFAHGTTHQTVYYPEAKAFHVCIPERTEQDATVALLGALDDKIENNKAIASIANKLARTKMVKLWQDHNLGSLTKESPILPPGWTRTTLGALCATGGGGIQTGPFGSQLHASDYVESGTPSVMPQNIGDNIITEDGIARVSLHDINRLSKYLLQEGDIVYSRRGDVKRRSLVRPHESGWLCGTGCLRVRTGASVEPLFMSHYLGEPEVQEWILQRAIGATMPNLNTSIMSELPVTLPPREVRQRFTDELSAVDARATHGLHENRILVDLRDTLLPQLMSGKLRIRDAERIVEDAV